MNDKKEQLKELDALILRYKGIINKLETEKKKLETDIKLEIENKPQPVALAVNVKKNLCSIIYSKATFDQLVSDFELYKTEFRSTNWNGCDDITRTLQLENLHTTGKKSKFTGKEIGCDYDHGHSYDWTFKYDEIWEVQPN